MQDSLEARSSVYHVALTLQNAFMHSGTTSDVFLRENLEWLGLATNWAKFSATAALGVIHKGHFEESMNILGPYLPQQGGNDSGIPGSQYSEGGALYALGLVNAGVGSGRQVEEYLRNMLRESQNDVVQHGAALGLGVAGMGGKNAETYDELKQALFREDSAVAGEAAGFAMGLIMLGTADVTASDEMLQYARETEHEKIIRGIAIGIAFIYYGKQEEADSVVKVLLSEKVKSFSPCEGGDTQCIDRAVTGERPSCDMVVFSHWRSHMQARQTTMRSGNSSTSPCLTLRTTFGERRSSR